MITRYTDLAANERTYLAWMRTALALIAFGFLLERFDLLVRYFAKSMVQERMSVILETENWNYWLTPDPLKETDRKNSYRP